MLSFRRAARLTCALAVAGCASQALSETGPTSRVTEHLLGVIISPVSETKCYTLSNGTIRAETRTGEANSSVDDKPVRLEIQTLGFGPTNFTGMAHVLDAEKGTELRRVPISADKALSRPAQPDDPEEAQFSSAGRGRMAACAALLPRLQT